jgi:phosphatidylserine synthase
VHAGAAWLTGAKVKSFKVTSEGGSVTTDKSNTVIELSPYFIPVYAIIISLIYFVVASSYNISGRVFIFLIGFALAFHLISTIEVMKIRQPDIVKSGYFFSIILVYVLNIVVISMIFSLLFPSFSAKKFFIDTWMMSKTMYVVIVRQLFYVK